MVDTVFERLCLASGRLLTVVAVRDLLKISYQGAKKICDGGGIGHDTAKKAAVRLGVTVDWLMTGSGPKTIRDTEADNCVWPFVGVSQREWDSASDRTKGAIEGYARVLLDQEAQRAKESLDEKFKRAA